jgi:putative transposase
VLIRLGVRTLFSEPGNPRENGYVESLNGKMRDELLHREIFFSRFLPIKAVDKCSR